MTVHIFGIRHHGPGSARSVLAALEQLQPDIVLVEGPPDAEAILPLLIDEAMQPPVALLIYAENNPAQAVYYPFTTFSPEYQAIAFALRHDIPVRMMDLPLRYKLALPVPEQQTTEPSDPLSDLARAGGYDDAERWWDVMVEQRHDSIDMFMALLEAMSALRESTPINDPIEALREAYMRQTIHHANEEGFKKIAVICGAWHSPALHNSTFSAEDAQRLSGLEQIPLAATWVPWSYSRLSRQSGYGAGITWPGWYRFLWHHQDSKQLANRWLTLVAQHLRKAGFDASTAQVIDAVRLAETITILRERTLPDLHDLNEAAISVFCHGNELAMQLIEHDLMIGSEMGKVPASAPIVPLQRDFQQEAARLSLVFSEEATEHLLDLREEGHRAISRFLHRLVLLDLPWGKREDADFLYETWILQWDPALIIRLIERSVWGNTVEEAATAFALHLAHEAQTLSALTQLVHDVLFAELPLAAPIVVAHLENEAATIGDISQLMAALPPLANSIAYGDIRHTPTDVLRQVVDGMITRIIIGLPTECASLDEEATAAMLEAVMACDVALRTLEHTAIAEWHAVLLRMIDQQNIHGLLRGRFCRVLVDAEAIQKQEAVRQMRLALASMVMPEAAAAWIEGFLQHSGAVLMHDETLLDVMDSWVVSLPVDEFERILPLLRRTTSTFEPPEIRHIGRRIQGKALQMQPKHAPQVDSNRTQSVDRTLNELLGLKGTGEHDT